MQSFYKSFFKKIAISSLSWMARELINHPIDFSKKFDALSSNALPVKPKIAVLRIKNIHLNTSSVTGFMNASFYPTS